MHDTLKPAALSTPVHSQATLAGQGVHTSRGWGWGPSQTPYLQLLQLWVEAGEGHVAHVGTRRGVTFSHQHEPRVRSSSRPFALILFFHLWLPCF